MPNATFISKSTIYPGDYSCVLRSPSNEFTHSLHYHDFYEFVIYLGNAGVFRIDESEYLVKRGDIVMIDMFKPHALLYNKNTLYERFSISIDLSLLISFSTPQSNLLDILHEYSGQHPIYHLDEQKLQKYLYLLDRYRDVSPKNGRDILEKALVHYLLAYIYSDCYTGKHTNEKDSQHAETIAQLLTYIEEHLNEEISLEQLAAEVNYSEYYVSRLFKKMSGKTLTSYIQEKRIDQAACLIRSGFSINQAAERVGFNNYSYFYKTFKKLMGCNPAEYQSLYDTKK